ncbi:MAG: alpha/beta hydrolase [Chloroflexi bacterium]|nr:alpha/beta hydrolase [Chloroflexota bacterium]
MTDRLLRAAIGAAKAGKKEEAVKMLSRVVKTDPRSAEGWFWLGMMMSESERKIYCFRRALKNDSAHSEARAQLEKLGYLKPDPPKKEILPEPEEKTAASPPSPFSDVSASPFSVDPDEVAFQDETKYDWDTEAEAPPTTEEPDFMPRVELAADETEDIAKGKAKDNKKKKQKLFLAILGVLAFVTVAGAIGLLFFSPGALNVITSAVFPPTATPLPAPTATPTMVPTPTPLPFSALDMGEYDPVFEKSDCAFIAPEDVVVECGFVTVPENRYGGDMSKTIRLAVAIYHGRERSVAPVLYLQGGPGQDTISLMSANFDLTIEPFLGDGDFILLDQRGMGLSEPNLDCPNLKKVYEEDAIEEIPVDKREEYYLTAFGECRERLSAQGVNLSAYNTTESASDVKDLILALGYKQATLFGVSYGTRLAQVVMREYPEVVRSVILDSVLPVESKIYNESAAIGQYSLDTLYAGCAANAECRLAYPDLEEDLRIVVAQLNEKPLQTNIFGYDEDDYSRSVDGVEFMSAILWAMRQPELLVTVPQAIERAKLGDSNIIGTILSFPLGTVGEISLGAYLSINCREQVYASTPEELGDDIASYPDTEEVGLSWVYGDPNLIFSLCDAWQVEGIRPGENEALASDIPTLVMAGQYDSTTPPFFAEQVAARLSRSTLVEFPGLGHAVAFSQTSSCPEEILQDFLSAPESIIETSCISKMESPQFSTPYTGEPPLEMSVILDEEVGLTTMVPTQWESLGQGFFYRGDTHWDITHVGAQHVPVSFDTWLSFLVENFNGAGLDSYPVETGEIVTEENGRIWKLYKATAQGHPVDFAFAKYGYDTIMVSMMSHEDEHDTLFDQVFRQMLEKTIVVVDENP